MAKTVLSPEEIFEAAKNLNAQERLRLADLLYSSEGLNELGPDKEWERAWAAEVERRDKLVDSGMLKLIDHEVAMARLDAIVNDEA